MAKLPTTGIPEIDGVYRQKLEQVLPPEREILGRASDASFVIADEKTIIFRFPPVAGADGHDVEWGDDPDFNNSRGAHVRSGANQVPVNLPDSFVCNSKWYFRFRGDKNGTKTEWSPTSVFSTPIPAALTSMSAAHTVDNTTEENPIINVNIVLPTTATIGASTIADPEALWTDHVDVESDWSTLASNMADDATVMNVATGHGVYFKPFGYYKIDEEIVRVQSVTDDAVTVWRGELETEAAAHTSTTTIRFYARVLREMFTGSQAGKFAVILTIPNPEKVRQRDFDAWAVSKCGTRGPLSEATALLDLPGLIDDLAAEPFFQKIVLRWSELPWTAYRYEIYHSTTTPITITNADPAATAGVELLARPLADHLGEATFVHDISYASGVVHYYGVRAVDIFGGFAVGGGDTAGPLQPDPVPLLPSPDVENISATESPVLAVTSVVSLRARNQPTTNKSGVSCGFDPPSSDPTDVFGYCKIYLQPTGVRTTLSAAIADGVATTMSVPLADIQKLVGWQLWQIDSEKVRITGTDYTGAKASGNVTLTIARGQAGTTAVAHSSGASLIPAINPIATEAQGPTAPLFFTYHSIGEVTLYFVSVSVGGYENPILSSPNLTVDLDGQTSAPLEVQNLRGIKTQSGGKIFWSEGVEPDLSHYEVADLGSRTLENQADVEDKHIVAKVAANPDADVLAQYEWVEIEYEGEIAQGASSVVLGRAAAPIAELVPGRYDPIGAPPVSETLRFSRSSIEDDLTETNYTIVTNDEDTINLSAAPAEAVAGDAIVRFFIGSRTHKFYVRAVNNSGMASEWRPVEGEVLELAARAPDGSHDLGPPKKPHADGTVLGLVSYCAVTPRPGTEPGRLSVQLAVRGESEDDDNFDTALKRNIGGINRCEIEITHSDDGVTSLATTTIALALSNNRQRYTWNPDPLWPGVGSARWTYFKRLDPINLPNRGISKVRVRVGNWFGWSDWLDPTPFWAPPGSAPFYTGNTVLQRQIAEVSSGGNTYPNIARSARLLTALTEDTIINPPEYRGSTTTPGSGIQIGGANAKTIGEVFTITVEQPDAGTPRDVTFHSSYKGIEKHPVNPQLGTYTSWTFLVESSTYFRCIGSHSALK